MTWDGLYLKG